MRGREGFEGFQILKIRSAFTTMLASGRSTVLTQKGMRRGLGKLSRDPAL
jgi:hypothetical protein